MHTVAPGTGWFVPGQRTTPETLNLRHQAGQRCQMYGGSLMGERVKDDRLRRLRALTEAVMVSSFSSSSSLAVSGPTRTRSGAGGGSAKVNSPCALPLV